MPELPEVETVRRGLEQLTLGRKCLGGDVLLQRTISHPFAVAEFLDGLQGTRIECWQRRGKYLLADLVDATYPELRRGWLGVHLRMTGQLLWLESSQPLQKHTRVRLFFADAASSHPWELRFVDQRTFGQMWWVSPEQRPEQIISGWGKLGPEPLSQDFSVAYLLQQLQQSRRPIKNALLDQTLVAGIGNIYADEALFCSGIYPLTPCAELRPAQVEKLQRAIVSVLQASLAEGGTTFSTFLNVRGVNGNYGGQALVYDRRGEPCHTCGTAIERIKLAGRSTHFCPQCQT